MRSFALFSLLGGAFAVPASFEESAQASLQAQLPSSPLKVSLQPGVLGSVVAQITNRGLATAYFSSWRNPLSEDELARRVEVVRALDKKSAQFLNAEGLPFSDEVPLDDIVKLASGATVTRLIDVAANYELQPHEKYIVQAEGFIPYHLEGETGWTKSAAYQASPVTITSDDHFHDQAVDVHDRHTFQGCSTPGFNQTVLEAIKTTAEISRVVAERVMAGKNKDAFMAYFKTDTPDVRKQVADRYKAYVTTLTGKDNKSRLSCRDCKGYYAMGAAWTSPMDGSTFFCPVMKNQPKKLVVRGKKCTRLAWPGVLMHELSHNARLFKPGTYDTAQDAGPCKRLTTAKALKNADTFNMFGQSVYLNTVCS